MWDDAFNNCGDHVDEPQLEMDDALNALINYEIGIENNTLEVNTRHLTDIDA